MKKAIYFVGTVLCSLAADRGCAPESRGGWENGPLLNGEGALVSIEGGGENGPLLNGKGAPGSEVQGRDVAGTGADGSALSGLTLHGSGLETMRISDGAVLSGAALVGATFATQAPDGKPIELRIDARSASALRAPRGQHRESLRARLQAERLDRVDACLRRAERRARACYPARGPVELRARRARRRLPAHEPDWITFACSGFGLYKCVSLGYEPRTRVRGEPLDRHHQACVRAFRADYCGDGRSYTVDGNRINIFDDPEIQHDTERWTLESEWDENGARCLSRLRIEDGIVPDCASELPGCDARPGWSDTLVVTEVP